MVVGPGRGTGVAGGAVVLVVLGVSSTAPAAGGRSAGTSGRVTSDGDTTGGSGWPFSYASASASTVNTYSSEWLYRKTAAAACSGSPKLPPPPHR